MKIKELLEAASSKPRNFVAKNAKATTSGAGTHKDKKRAEKQGDVKHKKELVPLDEDPSAGTTSSANVTVGAVYKNKPAKQAKNKDGTAKNALDMKTNIMTGTSIKR